MANEMKIYTRGFPDGWGYYRSAGYWIPGKIAPDHPGGITSLRTYRGDLILLYSREEALQAVHDRIQEFGGTDETVQSRNPDTLRY